MIFRLLILILVLIVAVISGVVFYGQIANSPTAPAGQYLEKKIVYTTHQGVDVEELQQDCSARGGEFNECGSPCADGEVCIQVCALTCTLP